MLDRRGAEGVADGFQIAFTQLTLIAENANLDQFVRIEAVADLTQDSVGEAILADRDDWVQRVGLGAQIASLGNGNFEHVFFNLSKQAFYRVLADETYAYKQGLDARARD